jgi:WD40 repeat protein
MKSCSLILCSLVLSGILIPAVSSVDPLWIQPAPPGNEFSMVAVSEDGSTIVAGGDQMTVLSRDGERRWTGWSSTFLDITHDGNYILSSQAHTVRLFSGSGIMLWDQSIGEPVTDLSISPDGALIAACGSGTIRTFHNSGTGFGSNSTQGVNHIKLSPAKDQIIVTTEKDVQRFNLSIVPLGYNDNSSQDLVDISGDGTSFVTGTYNRVWLYHAGGALFWERVISGGNVLALAYSRDGSTIVLGRDDNTVRVLDRDGTLLRTATTLGWVTSVGVSENGSTIVAGSMDKNLYVYDRDGTLSGTFTAKSPIRSHSVAVSGDGSVIAVVDATAVYGFSRTQFEVPVAPVTSVTTTTPVPIATTPAPATPTTAKTPVTAAGTPPRSALPLTVPLLSVIIFCAFCRPRER